MSDLAAPSRRSDFLDHERCQMVQAGAGDLLAMGRWALRITFDAELPFQRAVRLPVCAPARSAWRSRSWRAIVAAGGSSRCLWRRSGRPEHARCAVSGRSRFGCWIHRYEATRPRAS